MIDFNRKRSIIIKRYRKTEKCNLPGHMEALQRTIKMSLNKIFISRDMPALNKLQGAESKKYTLNL